MGESWMRQQQQQQQEDEDEDDDDDDDDDDDEEEEEDDDDDDDNDDDEVSMILDDFGPSTALHAKALDNSGWELPVVFMRTNVRRRFFFGDLCFCLLTDSVRLLPNNLLRSTKQHVCGSATGRSLPLQEILNIERWVAVRGMLLFFEVAHRVKSPHMERKHRFCLLSILLQT